ncbi:MAG: DUF1592 domain-containing protein [Limisphaerales bacterium]
MIFAGTGVWPIRRAILGGLAVVFAWVGVGVGLVGPGVARAADEAAMEGIAAFESRVKPFFSDYCTGCHGPEKKRGELDLEIFGTDPGMSRHREIWEKVRSALDGWEMPPEGKRQPAEPVRRGLIQWIDAELAKVDAATPPNPGRVTARRLNRNEYRNTIRDLLGVDYDAHASFPNDESGYGFDNIGDVLSLPPMLLEKYLSAAETIAREVIVTEDPALKRIQRIPASRFTTQADAVSTVEEETWGFFREGEIVVDHEFTTAGPYRLRVRGYGDLAGPELPRMGIRVDGKEVHVQSVRAQAEKPEQFEVAVTLEAGKHRLGVAYLNNFNSDGDRNLYLTSFEVVGPLDVAPEEYPEAHRRILPGRPTPGRELAYARRVLRQVANRAYRRDATRDEVAKLVKLVDGVMRDGGRFEEGIQLALEAILVSPHFLYRWEIDPEPLEAGQGRDLNGFEVASRLSYFLWSSMPDDTLLELARKGDLGKPEVRREQVLRMLQDSRSKALVRNFGGQWLQVRNLDQVEPDATAFPSWSPALRDAMRRETDLFLEAIVREDRSIIDLLDADFTFVNGILARHYGMEGIEGDEFQRVATAAGSGRGGVLTMGSVLTITSVPTRTAPVLRGKWILEQILGTPPPPPPPNVPPIEEGEQASKTATFRQRLELHRSKAECMPCHQKMDPLGFALENFNAIGAWRTQDGPHPIDNSAELPGGRKFEGATGLKSVLRQHPDFPKALASKLLTYALGRGLEPADRKAVQLLVDQLEKNDFKFSALLLGVVESEPFLRRQPEPSLDNRHASIHP